MSVPPFFLLPSILRSDRLYSTRSVIRTGLPLTPGALTGALTLTGPLPGGYNLVSVGGALFGPASLHRPDCANRNCSRLEPPAARPRRHQEQTECEQHNCAPE